MLRLFVLAPATVFAAQVNAASFDYPLAEVPYDGVTTGAYGDIQPGMTVLFGSAPGLDDLGRQRIRKAATADTLYFGRSSRGTHDGEVKLSDNAHITVLDDYRVWAKIPRIDVDESADPPTSTIYKDHDLEVSDHTTDLPPVANAGPGFAATIDPVTSVITVAFSALTSFSVSMEGIVSWLWDVADGTLTDGTAGSIQITATFPAGFRWVSLTVTDSNGKSHTAHVPVYARDPNDDDSIGAFLPTRHTLTAQGQQLTLRILQDIPAATYPDGTLVLLWEDEPSDPADRSHMKFIGWHHDDSAQIAAERLYLRRDTEFSCLDVAGKLDALPWFPNELSNVETPTTWGEMRDINMARFMHYVLHWHSTALEVADWILYGSDDYHFVRLETYGDSLYDQVDRLAAKLVPDHRLTCNRRGQLAIWPDPMLQDPDDRIVTIQATLDASDWSDLRYTHERPPRIHWLYEGAILSDSRYVPEVLEGNDIGTVFARAPGLGAPGQGLSLQEDYVHIARTQGELNAAAGHRYARLNAPEGRVNITLAGGDDLGIDPAHLSWVKLTLPADAAAQRGLSFTEARGLVHSLNVRYQATREGLLRTVDLEWERETVGLPADTYVPPVSTTPPGTGMPPGHWDDNPGGIEIPAGDPFAGDMQAYILWDGAHVFRTWDIQAVSPVWELVDTGISGEIYDGQYVHVNAHTVGMWLMTSTAIWWCADIMAETPSWNAVLPIATVQAADAVPTSGAVGFKCMANYASAPGYCIVATGPDTADTSNPDYAHAYYWITHDYGQAWTQVDMDMYTYSNSPYTARYCYAGHFAMEMFRSAPGTIWCVRQTPRIATNGRTAVFYSNDLGATWSKGYEWTLPTNDKDSASLLHPFPSATDPSYVMRGARARAIDPLLYRSVDSWVSGSQVVLPTGHDALSGVWRVNKRTYDTDHIIAWWRNQATSHADLLESEDGGANWSLLYQSGAPLTSNFRSIYNTPNGWPPDVDEWVIVRSTANFSAVVQYTDDRFQTVQDKQGNLSSLVAGWTAGFGSGFALPKVGPNT